MFFGLPYGLRHRHLAVGAQYQSADAVLSMMPTEAGQEIEMFDLRFLFRFNLPKFLLCLFPLRLALQEKGVGQGPVDALHHTPSMGFTALANTMFAFGAR